MVHMKPTVEHVGSALSQVPRVAEDNGTAADWARDAAYCAAWHGFA